jgi:hypothetical protein
MRFLFTLISIPSLFPVSFPLAAATNMRAQSAGAENFMLPCASQKKCGMIFEPLTGNGLKFVTRNCHMKKWVLFAKAYMVFTEALLGSHWWHNNVTI